MTASIVLHIDRIVVDAELLDGRSTRVLRSAVEDHLTTLLAGGTGTLSDHPGHVPAQRVDAGPDPALFARSLAQAVYRAVTVPAHHDGGPA